MRTAPHDAVPPPSRALRYKVQFTADQAYVDLLERARDLLWHQLPSGDLAELQRLALEALVEKLMRRKCGAAPRSTEGAAATNEPLLENAAAPVRSTSTERGESAVTQPQPKGLDVVAPARVTASVSRPEEEMPERVSSAPQAADVARYLPRGVRRGVWQRDGGRCTFRDARGVRCRATRALEFHHEQPFARGGPPSMENITLRCRAHNELAAEHDFGRELVRALKHRCNSTRE